MAEPADHPRRLLYSQREAAELLNMHVKRLVERVRAGELRYVLDGKRRKFTEGDLAAYIDRQREQTPAETPEGEGARPWGSTRDRTRRSSGGRSRSTVVG